MGGAAVGMAVGLFDGKNFEKRCSNSICLSRTLLKIVAPNTANNLREAIRVYKTSGFWQSVYAAAVEHSTAKWYTV